MSILKGMLVAMGKAAAMTFSGLYSGLGASPYSISQTVTVPAGNSGQIRFDNVSADATFQYKIGAGSYTTVTGGSTITVTNGQTLEFRVTGSSGTGGTCDLYDVSNGAVNQSVSMSLL